MLNETKFILKNIIHLCVFQILDKTIINVFSTCFLYIYDETVFASNPCVGSAYDDEDHPYWLGFLHISNRHTTARRAPS